MGRRLRCRLARRCAARKRGGGGLALPEAGFGVEVFLRCLRHREYADTSSPLGELHSYLWELIGYHRKQSSCGRAGTNGFPPGALRRPARKRVDPSRVARESGIRAADTNARGIRCLSGAHPVVCPVLPDAFSGRLRGDSNLAIPKREEGTGADHGPSSPVPQRARNALRLRFAPGR